MKIHDVLGVAPARKSRKRRGRGDGSGLGGTSGRGHKGAKARAGWKSRYGYEGGQMPIARRLPKRGFKNSLFTTRYDVINLGRLERGFENGDTVNLETVASRLGFSPQFGRLKILGTGELTKKLTVAAHKFSRSAREKIEAAGGTCTVLETRVTSEKKAKTRSDKPGGKRAGAPREKSAGPASPGGEAAGKADR